MPIPCHRAAPRRSARGRRSFLVLLLTAVLWLVPALALAHPLGNFTVNHYSRLELGVQQIEIFYVLDMAEIALVQEMPRIDLDGDGKVSALEHERYLTAKLAQLKTNLYLAVNERNLDLLTQDQGMAFLPGQGGLQTMRLTAKFIATLPQSAGAWQVDYRDDNDAGRIGWREIVIKPLAAVSLLDSTVSATDLSDELRTYPAGMLQSPLAESRAQARFAPAASTGEATAASAASLPATQTALPRATDGFADLVTGADLSGGALVLALIAAFGWGAAHAFTPGHGKTIVAAYLVGSRGTARHALFLGLTTTVTHTAGVFALGFVTLFLSHYILPETLYPWLGVLSGGLVVIIGFTMVRQRWLSARRPGSAGHTHHTGHVHDHTHDADHDHVHVHDHAEHDHDHGHTHTHLPPGADGRPITWRGLLALGISGGLLPCPSALIVLLSAIALQRVGLGILLIVAFSVGLASVLTGIGVLLVRAKGLFERVPASGPVLRLIPIGSAVVITLLGLGITLEALWQTGVLQQLILVANAAPL